jgi:class 3 adenylate cyclase/Flp pilus assembly protein TadD
MENPSAYLPIDRRRALARGEELPGVADGAVLFADLSGFTPLAEALAQAFGSRRGADELIRLLNHVYGTLIAEVHRHGGSIIGFSGDAITCWFAGAGSVSTCLAVAAALAMQKAISAAATIPIPKAPQITLAIKIAIAAGPVRRFVVGDPEIQLIDVVAGSTLERMAAVEQVARKGEVLLDELTALSIQKQLVGEWRTELERCFAVHALIDSPLLDALPSLDEPNLAEEDAKLWILPALYERMAGEQGQYLAELRPAVALFLGFDGIDYDRDPDAGARLDGFVRRVQQIVHRLEGALIQLTTGDKGTYLYVAFGAPIAHDDDTQRAVSAAFALRSLIDELPFIQNARMGISQGRMRVGAYGSESRRTYGVLGDETNLAARLMVKAAPGEILVSQRVAEVIADHYRLRSLGQVSLKGKREPQEIFAVEVERSHQGEQFKMLFSSDLVGRQAEVAQMEAVLAQMVSGVGQIIRLVGAAGIGKSHLAAAFLARAQERDVQVAVGSGQSTEQDIAYATVRQIARQLLSLNEQDEPQAQIAKITTLLELLSPDWLLRLPLLGDLLGLPIPENASTAAFAPQLRQEALIALAIEIVRARARQRPLLILFEDVHWIDESSRRMLLALARVMADVPILLLLVHRPLEGIDEALEQELAALPHQTLLHCAELNSEGVAALARHRLQGDLSPLALSFIVAQSQGNPFFTEELLDALMESGDLVLRDDTWTLSESMIAALRQADCLTEDEQGERILIPDAPLMSINLGLPDSIHGLVLARLDRLPEPVKLTLKVASVIGRVFEYELLARAHPVPADEETMMVQLETLSRREFARLERPQPRLAYIFKHNITQEVVYRTLLESQQQLLHLAVAEQLAQLQPEAVEQLAFHYHHSDLAQPVVRSRALHYLAAAGSKAKDNYANETALSYFERALSLEESWTSFAAKIDILHILGRRDEERLTLEALEASADAPNFEVYHRWGEYYESISEYAEAQNAVERALAAAQAVGDIHGQVRALARLGMVAWKQGNYDTAARFYQDSLTLLSAGTGYAREEADVRYGLGLLYRERSDYERARREFEQSLALNRILEDRQREARTLSALASIVVLQQRDYSEAIVFNQEALRIHRKIGDRTGEGASLLNLAISINRLGDYSQSEKILQEALSIQKALGARWWEMIVWNELGIVYMLAGDYAQAEYALSQALEICRTIGANAAYILCNLGQVFREQGNQSAAHQTLLEGYELVLAQEEKYLQAHYLSDLALLAVERGQFEEAITRAEKALEIFTEMAVRYAQQTELTTLARAWLALGNREQALHYIQEALAILDQSGGEGPDYPHRDYFRCYQVLYACGLMDEAKSALASAHQLLMARVEKISAPHLRRLFLENISFNREMLAAVAQSSVADGR